MVDGHQMAGKTAKSADLDQPGTPTLQASMDSVMARPCTSRSTQAVSVQSHANPSKKEKAAGVQCPEADHAFASPGGTDSACASLLQITYSLPAGSVPGVTGTSVYACYSKASAYDRPWRAASDVLTVRLPGTPLRGHAPCCQPLCGCLAQQSVPVQQAVAHGQSTVSRCTSLWPCDWARCLTAGGGMWGCMQDRPVRRG